MSGGLTVETRAAVRAREQAAGLTVVLITRNQEWNIRRLVDSVLDEIVSQPDAEVVLVDSASSDATIELVLDRPITVVRLHADQRLTAAAGRYVGNLQGSGELTLFLDGDMQLAPGWLERACAYLRDNPDVAVVTGTLVNFPVDRSQEPVHLHAEVGAPVEAHEVPSARGAGLYRRSVLEEVGSFRPYVYSDEEPELCIRIRRAGHRVVRLETPVAYHFGDPREEIATLLARRERRLFLGAGQNLRYLLRDPALLPYVRERGFALAPLGVLGAWLAFVAWCVGRGRRLELGVALVAPVGAVGAVAVRKRSVYRVVHSLVHRLVIVDGTLRGFLMAPLDPVTAPVTFDVVKVTHGGESERS